MAMAGIDASIHRRRLLRMALELAPASLGRSESSRKQRPTTTAVAPSTTPVPAECLLTDSQVKLWIAQGYITLKVDDLPREYHEQLYSRACELHRAKVTSNMRQEFGAELAADSDAILRSARTRGALTSLLGPDFAGNAWNGGVLAASNRDQGFHERVKPAVSIVVVELA